MNAKLVVLALICLSDAAHAESYAARVVRKKRYAQDIDPNAKAAATPDSVTRTLPSAPASNAVIEEDLVNPSGTPARREVKPVDNAPPPPPVEDGSNRVGPPPAPDPRHTPPPPPSTEEMRPRRLPPSPQEDGGRRHHAGDIDEDGNIGFSLNVGFGYKAFSVTPGLIFPIYRWLQWTLSGTYSTSSDGDDKETRYGPEAALVLRIPWRIPLTPFAGAGMGYDFWKREQGEDRFDDRSSPLSIYFVGLSIPMSEHLALRISETWRTYLGTPPRQFEDRKKYEQYGSTRFDVGLDVVF